eukprot:UN02510
MSSPNNYNADSNVKDVDESYNVAYTTGSGNLPSYNEAHLFTQPMPPPTDVPIEEQMSAPLYGTTDGYVVSQQASQTPYTTISLACTNPANPAFPQAADLYHKLAAKFGPHNIVPPPDFLQTDESRVEWLKRDQNRLLYFILTKDEHLKKMQNMIDWTICCALCSYEEVGPSDEYSPCSVCCSEVFTCCCCQWATLPTLYKLYFPSRANVTTSTVGGCPVCTGGIKFRQVLIKRWRKAGLDIEESKCTSCCLLCFCQPCVSIQSNNISNYYFQARYGLTRVKNYQFEAQYLREIDPTGNLVQYYST